MINLPKKTAAKQLAEKNSQEIVASETYRPNIYYIVFDEYGGEETLQKMFNFDNSELYNFFANSIEGTFPNPSNGNISIGIDLRVSEEVNLHIMDISGRIVWNTNTESTEGYKQMDIDLTSLAKGVYMLKATWGANSQTIRVIIN